MRYLIGLILCFHLSAAMTLHEKVGQVFMASIDGEAVGWEQMALLERTALGNVILFTYANRLAEREQVVGLTTGLREAIVARTGIVPLIAVDQEWGPRIRHFDFVGVTGAALAPLGINLNLAPVVDLAREGVVGDRAFSNDPEVVIADAKRFIEGLKPVGCCLKHFPGHGGAVGDSHVELPVMSEDVARNLEPFRQLWPLADAIMTAHVLVPQIDPDRCATLSPDLIGILRGWGYDGVIITDSLVMAGVGEDTTSAAIAAFLAGCDLLLLQGDFEPVMAEFQRAVACGVISEERLDRSVARVLKLKERLA